MVQSPPTHKKGKRIKSPISLLQASLWSVIGTSVAQLALLAANAVAAQLLGPELYGAYGLTISTANMVTTIASAGVLLVTTRGVAAIKNLGTAEDALDHVRRCLLTALILSVLAGLALCSFADWFSTHVLRNPYASGYLWAAAGLGVFLAHSQVRYAVLAGLQCFRDLAIVRLEAGLLGAVLLTASCLSHNVYLVITSAVVTALVSSRLAMRVFDGQLTTIPGDARANETAIEIQRVRAKDWKLLFPAVAAGVISTPVIWLCQAIASGGSGGLGAIAIITVMSMWMQAIMLVPSNIGLPLLPAMMNSYLKHDVRSSPWSLFLTSIGLVAVSTIPICAALMVLSSSVLALYGGNFSQHATPFNLLVIATGIQALSIPALIVVQVRGDLWIHFASNLVWAAIFIGCTVAFKADGVLGYARASLISFSAHACLVHAWAVFRLKSQM